ncbi:unnamed protein product [Symbiodinium sp. CCMP2456]|nr:unnamed protein product [Symbiodinium sp. CCMP2456]
MRTRRRLMRHQCLRLASARAGSPVYLTQTLTVLRMVTAMLLTTLESGVIVGRVEGAISTASHGEMVGRTLVAGMMATNMAAVIAVAAGKLLRRQIRTAVGYGSPTTLGATARILGPQGRTSKTDGDGTAKATDGENLTYIPRQMVELEDYRGAITETNTVVSGVAPWTSLARASEKIAVPTFSGEDLGLVLYQSLTGKAWVAAEELSVSRLGSSGGVEYFVAWLNARFLDLEIARIGRAFSDFFRKLRRRNGQSIREYNSEYDRLHARLREVGCCLPQECAAWLYVDRLQLDEPQELNLLSSVGNQYNLLKLQQAAVLHDRGHRKPWESKGRRPYTAHLTEEAADEDDAEDRDELYDQLDGDEGIPEEVAVAYATYQSAKDKYREQAKSRGYYGERNGPSAGKDKGTGGQAGTSREEKIKLMKARSYCMSCGKKGHWHKDAECPNRGAKEVEMCHHVPSEVYALRHNGPILVGITDTACAKSVAGTTWLQQYSDLVKDTLGKPEFVRESEAFKFGTGKVHHSAFYVIVKFELGGKVVEMKTSIINGDIPLLLSKGALAQLGMVYDVAANRASFNKVGLADFDLVTTSSGHPAIPIAPPSSESDGAKLVISDSAVSTARAYMTFAVACPRFPATTQGSMGPPPHLLLLRLMVNKVKATSFLSWWEGTKITTDFWLESDMDTPCKPPAISKMTKVQLLEECTRVGLVVHRSWSVEEIKAVIQEHRMASAATSPGYRMKSITSLNLPELKMKADELGVLYPDKVTKGNLLRLVRDHVTTPATELMKIGRYTGWEYGEIPRQYGMWAARETRMSPNPHPELVRFARWWENKEHETHYGASITFEENATVPYRPEDESAATSDAQSSKWSESKVGYSPERDARPVPPKAKSPSPGLHDWRGDRDWKLTYNPDREGYPIPPKINKCTSSGSTNNEAMEAEMDPHTLEEIQQLEARLAVLKDKAKGVPLLVVVTTTAGRVRALLMADRENNNLIHAYKGFPPIGLKVFPVLYYLNGSCCSRDDYTIEHDVFITEQQLLSGKGEHFRNYANGPRQQPDDDLFTQAIADCDYSNDTLLKLLDGMDFPKVKTARDEVFGEQGARVQYRTLGLYSHGGTFGVTTGTKQNGSMVRYLNEFARRRLGKDATWTSVTLGRNASTQVHHDFHNLRGSRNYTMSLGQQSGGELWLEDRSVQEKEIGSDVKWRRAGTGHWLPGRLHDTNGKFYDFDPFLKHATEPWVGDRWMLTFHSTRNYPKASGGLRGYLKNCGFPLPKSDKKARFETADKQRPRRSTRKALFNNAARISVMMASFICAAGNYLNEHVYPQVDYQPIVVFEIGGTEATEEAVALSKDVFEPMTWETYRSPEGKETAHHIINGGTPRELRLHLRGRSPQCDEAVTELIRQQLGENGTVVIDGPTDDDLLRNERFRGIQEGHKQYNQEKDGSFLLILFKSNPDSIAIERDDRVHDVCVVGAGEGERVGS